jgi:hypothetical protein
MDKREMGVSPAIHPAFFAFFLIIDSLFLVANLIDQAKIGNTLYKIYLWCTGAKNHFSELPRLNIVSSSYCQEEKSILLIKL